MTGTAPPATRRALPAGAVLSAGGVRPAVGTARSTATGTARSAARSALSAGTVLSACGALLAGTVLSAGGASPAAGRRPGATTGTYGTGRVRRVAPGGEAAPGRGWREPVSGGAQ